jgi:hypothetical protein
VEISGYLFAPEEGLYRFHVDTSELGVVALDDAVVLDVSKLDASSIHLSRGTHVLRIEIDPHGSDGFFDMSWDRPAFFEPLGIASYASAAPEDSRAPHLTSTEQRALGSLTLGAVWWCGVAYLLLRLGGRRGSVRPALLEWSRVRPSSWGGVSEAAGLTALFFTVGVALAMPALSWPMAFDDLVLLRWFSPEQILSSLHGQWDPERLMNLGFRPGSLVFNHLRYGLFGENVVAHRLFLLFLYGMYGALLVSVAARLGMDRRAAALGVVLAICSVFSIFHYVWITDGVHIIQGLAFVVAARLLLSGLDAKSRSRLTLSVLALLIGLVTREDTFAAIPALTVMGFCVARGCPVRRRFFYVYALSLLVLCGVVYQYRRLVLPGATPLGHDVVGLVSSVGQMLHPLGNASFDLWSRTASLSWWAVVAAAIAMALRHRERSRFTRVAMWFGCAVLACAPTLNLQRDNMFFFPTSFAALGFVDLFAHVFHRSRVGKLIAVVGLGVGIGGGFYVSRIFAENFHPRSLRVVWWNGRYVYGAYSHKAVIPEARLLAVKEQLARAGIRDEWLHLQHTAHLERRAVATGRRRPDAAGNLFYPLLPWGED